MSFKALEIYALAQRCPDLIYEVVLSDKVTFWNDLRRTCRHEDLGSVLDGC